MALSIVTQIQDMGRDHLVSIQQIDDFVDDCIAFLRYEEQAEYISNFSNDIFSLEEARQYALVSKYSLTVQQK